MGFSKLELKDLWLSLFNLDILKNFCDHNEDVIDVLMLLEILQSSTKGLCSKYSELHILAKNQEKDIELKRVEIDKLNHILKENQLPCQSCSSLRRDLKRAEERAKDAETRVNQIAQILNQISSEKQSAALTLLTESFSQSPKKKTPKKTVRKGKILVRETEEFRTLTDGLGAGIEIEETPVNDNILKKSEENEDLISVVSPRRSKRLSTSLLTSYSEKHTVTPKRDLSIDFGSLKESPTKQFEFNISTNNKKAVKENPKESSELDESLQLYLGRSREELEEIWFNNDSSFERKRNKKEKTNSWELKETHSATASSSTGGKVLKQLKLSVAPTDRLVDISSVVSNENVSSGEDEIVLPSPKKRGPRKKEIHDSDTLNETFAPGVTSTQKIVEESKLKKVKKHDDLPEEKKVGSSPKYKYKESPVRKKEERRKLRGWDCVDCKQFYELANDNLSPSKKSDAMNRCSRHRAKHKMNQATPPGFWDVDIPDTQECKERKMYTSVYLKPDK